MSLNADQPSAKSRIFLSYSRKDTAFAVWLRERLEADGIEVYRDVEDTLPSEEWWARLQKLIAKADTVVFLLSPNSVASRVCTDEVRYAKSLNKRIFPVVIQDVDWGAVPEGLAKLHAVSFADPQHAAASLAQLGSALMTDIGWVRQHTYLMEHAQRWDNRGRARVDLLSGKNLDDAEAWLSEQPQSAEAPTKLHREFIQASRAGATRRQRNWIIGSLGVAGVAMVLAGLAYWQSRVAVRNADRALIQEGKAKTEVARGLTAGGEPVGALRSAIDGTEILIKSGAPTRKAEAILYDLLWAKTFPLATTNLNAKFTDYESFSLVAKTIARGDGAGDDAFCIGGKQKKCLALRNGKITKVEPERLKGELEFIRSEELTATAAPGAPNAVIVSVGGAKIRIAARKNVAIKDVLAHRCPGQRLIIQYNWQGAKRGKFDTLVHNMNSGKTQRLQKAPPVSEIDCHRNGKHIVLTGKYHTIGLYDSQTGKLHSPSLIELPTLRYGFGSMNNVISLSKSDEIFVFSGTNVTDAPNIYGLAELVQPQILRLSDGRLLTRLEGHKAHLAAAVISRSGKQVATLTKNGMFRIWSLAEATLNRMNLGEPPDLCRYKGLSGLSALAEPIEYKSCFWNGKLLAIIGADHARKRLVAAHADGPIEAMHFDRSGKIRKAIPLLLPPGRRGPVYFSTARLLADGQRFIMIGPNGRLHLVDLAAGGKITASWGEQVLSIGRIKKSGVQDQFIVLSKAGFFKLAIAGRGASTMRVKPMARLKEKGHDYFHNILQLVNKKRDTPNERGNMYIELKDAPGSYHLAGKTLLHCGTYTMGSVESSEACAVFDFQSLDPIADPTGQKVCLSALINSRALICLSRGRDQINAFHFGKHRWLSFGAGGFVVPELATVDGNITMAADAFAGCPYRVAISYSEYVRGGGGLRSPGRLIYDLKQEKKLMTLSNKAASLRPMFCRLDALMKHGRALRDRAQMQNIGP